MLQYQSIYAVNQANHRLSSNRRSRWAWSTTREESDKLTLFTLGSQADRECRENLRNLIDLGKLFKQHYVIFTSRKIQFLGAVDTDILEVEKNLYSSEWLEKFEQWGDQHGLRNIRKHSEVSGQGAMIQMLSWKRCFALSKYEGVYSIESGNKITNRREIIQKFWDFGFASLRGRPLTVATIARVGERSDLEQITELAEIYYYKRNFSEAAKKIVANFTSLNRVAAWPDAW